MYSIGEYMSVYIRIDILDRAKRKTGTFSVLVFYIIGTYTYIYIYTLLMVYICTEIMVKYVLCFWI